MSISNGGFLPNNSELNKSLLKLSDQEAQKAYSDTKQQVMKPLNNATLQVGTPLALQQASFRSEMDKELSADMSDLSAIISQKLSMASGAAQINMKTAIQILISALDDVQGLIQMLEATAPEDNISPKVKGQISALRGLEGQVFSKIRVLLGSNLSDDRLREMIEKGRGSLESPLLDLIPKKPAVTRDKQASTNMMPEDGEPSLLGRVQGALVTRLRETGPKAT